MELYIRLVLNIFISIDLIALMYVLFSIGIWSTKSKLNNPKYSISMSARIVGIKEEKEKAGESSHSFRPIVVYNLNGQDYQFVLKDTLNSTVLFNPRGENLSHNVGDIITLKVNPLDMSDCYSPEIKMATLESLYKLRKVVMGIILLFCILFILSSFI